MVMETENKKKHHKEKEMKDGGGVTAVKTITELAMISLTVTVDIKPLCDKFKVLHPEKVHISKDGV